MRRANQPYIPKDKRIDTFLSAIADRSAHGSHGSNGRIAAALGYSGEELEPAKSAVGTAVTSFGDPRGYNLRKRAECKKFMRDLKAVRKATGDPDALPTAGERPHRVAIESQSTPEPEPTPPPTMGVEDAIRVLEEFDNPLAYISRLVELPKLCCKCGTAVMPIVVALNRKLPEQPTPGELQEQIARLSEQLEQEKQYGRGLAAQLKERSETPPSDDGPPPVTPVSQNGVCHKGFELIERT